MQTHTTAICIYNIAHREKPWSECSINHKTNSNDKANITHMWKRWGKSQNFFVALIDNLKNNYLLKKLLKWANEKCKNFNIYNVVFEKKNKEKYLRYHYFTPVYQTSQLYDLQILKYRVWQTEIGNCGSFLALLPPKNPSLEIIIRILKKWKKLLEMSSF